MYKKTIKGDTLRVCVTCSWFFTGGTTCPQCGSGSHQARRVFPSNAYKYAKTQQLWHTYHTNRDHNP